ncbi:hypothetical protein Pmani_016387 [Petrolisthes manimaculis]|uniref:Uncharacterized protein n=1 Tax=Petrolisthes manimaculis TaxID=1843537 RepID=A0AAE1PQ79_9EUCA|nr:hypothetical protein Pmani_016387 [Petrolisthes manimaculis]
MRVLERSREEEGGDEGVSEGGPYERGAWREGRVSCWTRHQSNSPPFKIAEVTPSLLDPGIHNTEIAVITIVPQRRNSCIQVAGSIPDGLP